MNYSKPIVFLFAMGVSILFVPSISHADIFSPPGLGAGEKYHLVFVTSTTTTAESSDIDFYNGFVNALAVNAGLGEVDWFVMGSTATVDARDNALVSAPVYMFDGTRIADGFDDLWDGTLLAAINRSELNDVLADVSVWTGSGSDGFEREAFGEGATVAFGNTNRTNGQWMRNGFIVRNNELPLYALSAELTAVPEPSSIALVVIAAIGIGFRRPRRNTEI